MKDNTVKIAGHVKDRFLERFFAEEVGLDVEARKRLVLKSQSAFTSLRVRKAVLSTQRTAAKVNLSARPAVASRAAPSTVPAAVPAAAAAPVPSAPGPGAPSTAKQPTSAPASAAAEGAAFDPYVFGLVPIFQREGREGLLAKLAGIESVDHLRQMAKAQQVVLPQELRLGQASAEQIRSGIADAVAKRIADRRAAAG